MPDATGTSQGLTLLAIVIYHLAYYQLRGVKWSMERAYKLHKCGSKPESLMAEDSV